MPVSITNVSEIKANKTNIDALSVQVLNVSSQATEADKAIVNSPVFKEHLPLRRAEIIRVISFLRSVGKVGIDGDNITGSRHVGANENIEITGHGEPQ